jgi:hypothetical protein
MEKVKLRGFEKCQNSEEHDRLLKVTGGSESPYDLGEEASSDNRYRRRERLLKVGEAIARKRGCM